MHYDKVILIGYRATGKSSVGKILARHLSFRFLDMDKVIEERTGCSIQAMVAKNGWQFFRDKEKELLAELASQNNLVIATGGGAILHQEIWQGLKESGLVVWLTADRETICGRLLGDQKTSGQRPALTDTDTFSEVDKVLTEREPLYRSGSHISIDTGSLNLDQVVAAIEKEIL